MKRRIVSIMIIFILFFSAWGNMSTFAGGKTITIERTGSWRDEKQDPPETYYYSDYRTFGTLNLTNKEWEEDKRTSNRSSWALLSNDKDSLTGSFMRNNTFSLERKLWEDGYNNATITGGRWTSDIREGSFTGWNGKTYKYRRGCYFEFEYEKYRYVATYSGIVTNKPSLNNITVTNPKSDKTYHNQDRIEIQTRVKDLDVGDRLRLRYRIGTSSGYVVGATTRANGTYQSVTGYIPLSQSIDGEYNIEIWADDSTGGRSSTRNINNVKITNILKEVSDDIEKFVVPRKESDLRIIIADTDDDITSSSYNNNYISDIKNMVNDRDSHLYIVGTNGSQSYLKDKLTENYCLNTSDRVQEISDYIISENNKLNEKNTNIFLVNDYISYTLFFSDLEKDYKDITIEDKLKNNDDLKYKKKQPKELKALYTHDPSIFDNPVSKHSKADGQYHDIEYMKEDEFLIQQAQQDMRGKWTINLKSKDDTGVESYDKSADEKEYTFIVHKKPKAIITKWQEETATKLYYGAEKSFDIDYQITKPNKGIKIYTWKYQVKDGTWHDFSTGENEKRITLSKTMHGQEVTNVSLTVLDYNGATDTVISAISPPFLQEPEAILIAPKYIYVGEHGSDRLTVNNDSYPKNVIDTYTYDFDFASVSNNLDTTKNTKINNPSYTFNKNTLKSIEEADFDRQIKYSITYTMPDTPQRPSFTKTVSTTANISIKPVVINKEIELNPVGSDYLLSCTILNSNNVDHKVITTVKGNEYEMDYKENEIWEKQLNIEGANDISIKIINENDNDIIYDKKLYINNNPSVSILDIQPPEIYEGDDLSAKIEVNDLDLDTLKLKIELLDKENYIIRTINKTIKPKGDSYDLIEQEIYNNIQAGDYELRVTVEDIFGAKDTVTATLKVLPLRLLNFRVTDIVNHPHLTFPIGKDNCPIEYKTGYYSTFQINAKGDPTIVETKISINGSLDKVINLKKVNTIGTETVWEGKYYTDAETPNNTVISMELIAHKGSSFYNYNEKEGWNGRVLIIKGTALQDAEINRTN